MMMMMVSNGVGVCTARNPTAVERRRERAGEWPIQVLYTHINTYYDEFPLNGLTQSLSVHAST